jgi:predicted TIM-barrel fold metal-dependent hydrolase
MAWIDAHVHIWTQDTTVYTRRDRYPIPGGTDVGKIEANPPDFPPETLLSIARPFDVDRIGLVQMSFYGTDNSYMIDTIKRWPDTFRAYGYVDPESEGVGDQIAALLTQGITGFRVVPEDAVVKTWLQTAGYDAMFAAASETGQAISCLVNADAFAEIDRMCGVHPGATVVIDHLGRIGAGGTIRESDVDALCALAGHENVYVKVSAFYALGNERRTHEDLIPFIRRVYDAYGPDRLMWASDAPPALITESYEEQISLVRDRIDFLSGSDRDKLMRETAERIIFFQ